MKGWKEGIIEDKGWSEEFIGEGLARGKISREKERRMGRNF